MIRNILSLVLLVAAAVPALAQESYSQGRLWMVEADGVAPSWLVGTMHSTDPTIARPWPALARVLNGVDSVTVELVLDDAALEKMGQAMTLTDGRTLSEIAGPARMARILKVGATYGFPPDSLEPLKPWAATMVFSLPPSEFERQSAGDPMLDNVLREHAEARGIPVYGIETIAEQIGLFANFSEAEQLEMLDMTMEMHPQAEAQFNELRRAWLAGDLGRLYDMAMEPPPTGSPELIETFTTRLIQDRNYRMAERITPLLDQGNALIAVGALHLPGDEGVLALLEQAGYLVSPVE